MDPNARGEVLKYIHRHRPLFIIMGPPCTSFGCWSRLNRYIHPDTWRQTRRIGIVRAGFAAEVAGVQLATNRHFLIENPRGSDPFALPPYAALWNTEKVVEVTFPQSALGLQVHGEPILKYTTFWVSSILMAEPFVDLKCYRSAEPIRQSASERSERVRQGT